MNHTPTAWIAGAGIAGLATAAYLIRNGWAGRQIQLLEQEPVPGGSLDGAGDPERGYRLRGGRMLEPHFGCTWDLFDEVPDGLDPGLSVTAAIHAFSRAVPTSSRCRLVADRERVEAPDLELGMRERRDLLRLLARSETSLGRMTIEAFFGSRFLATNFWLMWCSMFAFQPWHSVVEFRRYMRRFMHLLPGFNRLEGIMRTPLNQYDSLVRPLTAWLVERGVHLRTAARVERLEFGEGDAPAHVTGICCAEGSHAQHIVVGERDVVITTLGSMTAASAFGTLEAAPRTTHVPDAGAWALWRNIAQRSPLFGRPEAFCGDVSRSTWHSFTVTLRDPAFFRFMERFSGNGAGTGGLVTFRNSRWLLSIVLPFQPHFADQPDDAWVFWGYALRTDRTGDCVPKPIADCNGAEILEELASHLPLDAAASRALRHAICIPCALPYITSQFMPRAPGDRPAVVPGGARNFAFVGQFCEVPDDTVFTVEYSIRTAQLAAHGLLGRAGVATPLFKGYRRPGVLLAALRALL